MWFQGRCISCWQSHYIAQTEGLVPVNNTKSSHTSPNPTHACPFSYTWSSQALAPSIAIMWFQGRCISCWQSHYIAQTQGLVPVNNTKSSHTSPNPTHACPFSYTWSSQALAPSIAIMWFQGRCISCWQSHLHCPNRRTGSCQQYQKQPYIPQSHTRLPAVFLHLVKPGISPQHSDHVVSRSVH